MLYIHRKINSEHRKTFRGVLKLLKYVLVLTHCFVLEENYDTILLNK